MIPKRQEVCYVCYSITRESRISIFYFHPCTDIFMCDRILQAKNATIPYCIQGSTIVIQEIIMLWLMNAKVYECDKNYFRIVLLHLRSSILKPASLHQNRKVIETHKHIHIYPNYVLSSQIIFP